MIWLDSLYCVIASPIIVAVRHTIGGKSGMEEVYSGISSSSATSSIPFSVLLILCWIRNLLTCRVHHLSHSLRVFCRFTTILDLGEGNLGSFLFAAWGQKSCWYQDWSFWKMMKFGRGRVEPFVEVTEIFFFEKEVDQFITQNFITVLKGSHWFENVTHPLHST